MVMMRMIKKKNLRIDSFYDANEVLHGYMIHHRKYREKKSYCASFTQEYGRVDGILRQTPPLNISLFECKPQVKVNSKILLSWKY